MKSKHHGFSRVFGLWLSRNPDFAFKVPFKPLLFHIVRGQHMMPNVISDWYDYAQVSSQEFFTVRLF
jgi:hypothetical protein